MIRFPRYFTELKFSQFNDWKAFCFENPEASEARQLQAMFGLTDAEMVRSSAGLPFGYLYNLLGQAPAHLGKVKELKVAFAGQSVTIKKGFDFFDLTFGAAQQVQEAHDTVCNTVFNNETYKELSERLEGKKYEDLTDAEKLELFNFRIKAEAAYYKILPEVLAWVAIGLAKIPINEENYAKALRALSFEKAFRVLPILDGFLFEDAALQVIPQEYSTIAAAAAVGMLKLAENELTINPRNLNDTALMDFKLRSAKLEGYKEEESTNLSKVAAFAKKRRATAFAEVEVLPFMEYYLEGKLDARERERALNLEADAKPKTKI